MIKYNEKFIPLLIRPTYDSFGTQPGNLCKVDMKYISFFNHPF